MSKVRPSANSDRTIPSLDGIRAISIALVILAHAHRTRGFPGWIPGAVADHGTLGVQIFFIISGFLITRLLAKEQTNTGGISLKLFYARRFLRIFPPFYLFLGVVALGTWMGLFSVPLKNLLFAVTYTMNYVSSGIWITGHIWSLSVEEQFYLAWPLTVKLAGLKRAYWIAGCLALTAPLFTLAVYLRNKQLGDQITHYFPLVVDSIAAGCVLAGVLPWLRRQPFFPWLSAPVGGLVILLIPVLDLARSHPRIHMAIAEPALNLSICYSIVRYTEFPESFFGRILNLPPLAFAGKVSYSLYLWQQLFMNRFGGSFLQAFPVNLAASCACALASYCSVELPMAGMRKRLRPAIAQGGLEKRKTS